MAEKSTAATRTASEPEAKGSRREATPFVPLSLAGSLLDLQSAVGNRSAGRLLGGALLQPKLRIGPADDSYEREADRVAEAFLGNGPIGPISEAGGDVQRMCTECEEELVQRMCAECQEEKEEKLLQPKADGAPPSTVSPAFETRLGSLRGSGRPLPAPLRGFFEPRFGHDFGAVRVHTGGAAGKAAQAVSARAFTVGNDVVFGAGEWSPGTTAGKRLLAHELTHVVQQTPLVARRKPLLQRAPEEAGEAAPQTEESASEPESPEPAPEEPAPESSPGEPGTEPVSPESIPATAIVVDDSAEEVGEGQMKKSDFMARLRTEVCGAAETGLAGTAHSAQGCPLIEFWFGHYESVSAERINRDLPRFVEAEPRPATAEDYIAVITERVRRSVSTWASTGEITGVPRDLPLPGMNLPGVGASAARVSGAASSGVSFKALPGGPRDPGDPQALRAQLGAGRPLDGGIRSRMESAFGRSFSHVRVHTDGQAAGLSHRLNARAFAVGSDVAFGAGEYRPGTLVGDALMAHELAHVAQQEGAAESVQPMRSDSASYGALERDADLAAVGAVASLWGLRLPGLRRPFKAAPRLSSGLRLQRCGICDGPQQTPATGTTPTTPSQAPTAPPPQPQPATPPRLDFQTSDKGERPGTCGSFSWQTQWQLDRATTRGGIVVQKITLDFDDVKFCDNRPAERNYVFWEGWEIRPNQTTTTVTAAGHRHDDEWIIASPVPGTKGQSFRQRGSADFYEGQTLPRSFQVDRTSPAKELPMTWNDPRLTGGSGPKNRALTATWDCCDPNSTRATTLTHR